MVLKAASRIRRHPPLKGRFFSPAAHSHFRTDRAAWAAGATTQQRLLACHILTKAIEVSFIVGDYGQGDIPWPMAHLYRCGIRMADDA